MSPRAPRLFRRAAVAAAIALGAFAPAASAACPAKPATQVFAAYGDSAFYSLVPGGDFTAGAPGWALTGAASVTRDGALELADGASATTPAVCVQKGDRWARAFARTVEAGTRDKSLRVDVLFADGAERRAGVVAEQAAWAPTQQLRIAQRQVDRAGETIRLRFSAGRGATWLVDDVHVDPFMR